MARDGPRLSGHGPLHSSYLSIPSTDQVHESSDFRDRFGTTKKNFVTGETVAFEIDDSSQSTRLAPRPTRLKKPTFWSSLILVGDVVLIAAPLFFIFLGISVLYLHLKPTVGNEFGPKVENATRISLELLMASRSVWGTIESAFSSRRLTLIGGPLLLLWALSPLGGQASLRILEKQDQTRSGSFRLRYLDTGPAAGIWPDGSFGPEGTAFMPIVKSLLNAVLLSPDDSKRAPQDTWGNVKIPRLETLNASAKDPEGWINIPANPAVESYSSLVGLSVVGIPSDADSTFNLESSYISTNCFASAKTPYTSVDWDGIVGQVWAGRNPLNATNDDNTAAPDLTIFLDTYMDLNDDARLSGYFGLQNTSLSNSSLSPTVNETRKIAFGSVAPDQNGTSVDMVFFNCSVAETHVETIVNCSGKQCALTFMDINEITGIIAMYLSRLGGSRGQSLSSPAETFINDTTLASYYIPSSRVGHVDLSLLPLDLVSARLAIVLNTCFQISTFPGSFLGHREQNLSLYGPDTTPIDTIQTWFGSNATIKNVLAALESSAIDSGMPISDELRVALAAAPFVAVTSNGTATRAHQIYVCNFVWLAWLLISTIALLIIGIVGIVLKERTLAPDMLGYVASMTYENPHGTDVLILGPCRGSRFVIHDYVLMV
ncbi:hypothetical protein B0A49_09811 [Cryomyces minteri]|uniref:Transmembrane protein n=1 Tax=Cryomyces minteri TaxID=331657 RepID=A0A4U0WHM3_9PEZI|nr:hypothetical protein B0A49_09811 [Cryomyces minteri]